MKDDRIFKELLDKYMDGALRDPSVQRDKEEFIRDHFAPVPPSIANIASVSVPALALIALFFLVWQFFPTAQPIIKEEPAFERTTAALEQMAEESVVVQEKIEEKPEIEVDYPPVYVKRASSRTGNVMVYQKTMDQTPVTIIWVFPGGH